MNFMYSVSGVLVLAITFVSGMLFQAYQSNNNTYKIGDCVRRLGDDQIYKVNHIPNQYEIELTYPNKFLKGGLGYQLVFLKNLIKVSCEK